MKALVKAKPEEGIWMDDVPMPKIGPDDVLIRITKTAICGTDIHAFDIHEGPTVGTCVLALDRRWSVLHVDVRHVG